MADLKLAADGCSIVVSAHSPHEPADLDATYSRAYKLDADAQLHPSSRHSVAVVDASGASFTCLLTASGGAWTVHGHSALVHERHLVLAVGPHMCALSLPTLELVWSVAVDHATCFGVYYSPRHDCYVSHGELTVARVTLDGHVVWSAGGKDIFTEGFTLQDDHAEVADFNHERYRIDLATGRSIPSSESPQPGGLPFCARSNSIPSTRCQCHHPSLALVEVDDRVANWTLPR